MFILVCFFGFEEDGAKISWVGVQMMVEFLGENLKILSICNLIPIKKILLSEVRE